eukprot:UN13946
MDLFEYEYLVKILIQFCPTQNTAVNGLFNGPIYFPSDIARENEKKKSFFVCKGMTLERASGVLIPLSWG